jgi:hypothetical protein
MALSWLSDGEERDAAQRIIVAEIAVSIPAAIRAGASRRRPRIETEETDLASPAAKCGRACNSVQGATVTMASSAMLAIWNPQLTESKESCWVRIPPSPPPQTTAFK